MKLEDYILLYLKDNPSRISSIRFWAMTLLVVSMGMKIQNSCGHYLTIEDCFKEMEDAWMGIHWEGGWVRTWWEQFQYLRGLMKKQRWMD